MREWNPLWQDLEDDDNAEYLAAIRRIVMASINFIEDHPQFTPRWLEKNRRSMMRAAGIPDSVAESSVAFAAAWQDIYQPHDSMTREWFRQMSAACSRGDPKGQPSAHMLGKGIACGILLKRSGWDEFNAFMLTEHEEGRTRQ